MTAEAKKEFNLFEILYGQVVPILLRLKKVFYVPLICALVAFLLGYSGEKKKQPIYSTKIVYMLEDEISSDAPKTGGNSQLLAVLSGQAGQSNKGMMVELSLSNKFVEATLCKTVEIEGKKVVLVNYYMDNLGTRDEWKKEKNEKLVALNFPENYKIGTDREKDYLLRVFSNAIKATLTSKVQESGLIRIEYSCNNELFAKYFVDNHLLTIADFYISKKIEKAKNLAELARRKRDSLNAILSGRTQDVATRTDLLGAVKASARVGLVQSQREATIAQEQYKESVIAYSTASLDLERRRPFISVVDDIRLPLSAIWPEPFKKGIIYGVVGLLLGAALLIGVVLGLDFLKVQRTKYKLQHQTPLK